MFYWLQGCKEITPLYIFFPKMRASRRDFDKTKYLSFLIKDDELLEKYNEVWKRVKHSLRREFDIEPVDNEKYLKAKIKSFNGKINTKFHNNKIPREGSL